MSRMKILRVITTISACALLLSARAGAQQSASGIAGVVKDAAGVPIAGVTVEAASGALIEKTRTVVTDGQGQFKIVDVPPGTYDVTLVVSDGVMRAAQKIVLNVGNAASATPGPGTPTVRPAVTPTVTR